MTNIAVILSGGTGTRMGLERPKQYVEVNGTPVIYFCLNTFFEDKLTDAIAIVVADEWKAFVDTIVSGFRSNKPVLYSKPGETRQYSIFNALRTIKQYGYSDDDIVLIHDAARPLVSHELIRRCYEGCREADGIMPVIPVKDTAYLSRDGKHISSLLQRNQLWNGQAPEAFHFGKYYAAHESMDGADLLKINGSTELAYKAGMDCRMVEGDPMNIKITTQEDLITFEAIINSKIKQ